MKKKLFRRMGAFVGAAALAVGALAMFAGCTTKHPEITITYRFNNKDYAVDYTLSRNDAPKTVQHFLELADAGFYDGLCVHDYASNGTFLYTGGYKIVDGELEEVDYYSAVKSLEESGKKFTQSVWTADALRTPLYSVYGEFFSNGTRNQYTSENWHRAGALVMYYTDKGNFNGDVTVLRADGGKNNDGNKYQESRYVYNSATSLFYTYTGSADSKRDENYCVFGMAKDYEKQLENGLLKAISDYTENLGENVSFTQETEVTLNRYDPFEEVKKEGRRETFNTPVEMPITIQSVKVNKY